MRLMSYQPRPAVPVPAAQAIADQLIRLYVTMEGIYQAAARSVGLTPQQAQILCMLANERPALGELAAMTNTTPKNMTGLVDRLVDRGQLTRGPDPRDRRVSRVELTADGTASVQAFEAELHVILAAADLPTDPAILEQLRKITDAVANAHHRH